MKNILTIIKDTISEWLKEQNIYEGVGDKFFQSKTGRPDDFNDFEKNFALKQSKESNYEIFYKRNSDNWTIIKNPNSLKNFAPSVRGVISQNGDLYLELIPNGTIHNDIIDVLKEMGVLSASIKKNWGSKIPQESGFLTVQKYRNYPIIAIGESNRLIYDINNYNNLINYYNEFLNKAKSKNPNINFVNKLVGSKSVSTTHSNILMNEAIAKQK